MGRYYAEAQGEDEAVAHAIEDHYRPKGPDDLVPADPVAIAVALADKIDMLVGFWAIDEKPTGSKDPYALRRAALGVIRIVLDNELRLPLRVTLWRHFGAVARDEQLAHAIALLHPLQEDIVKLSASDVELALKLEVLIDEKSRQVTGPVLVQAHAYLHQTQDLLSFFADRLKVQLREQGARHDLVDAVFALGGQDDLSWWSAASRRSANSSTPTTARTCSPATSAPPTSSASRRRRTSASIRAHPMLRSIAWLRKRHWRAAIAAAKERASTAVAQEDFAAAMRAMASLRPHVDSFFDKVTVNVDDAGLRENRLSCSTRSARPPARWQIFRIDRGRG